ncbi:MAG: hypothetical protein WAM97_04295 [Acidimicrobiales bacterium]
MIAAVIAVVVAVGGIVSYFAFAGSTPTATTCQPSLSSSVCGPGQVTPTTPPSTAPTPTSTTVPQSTSSTVPASSTTTAPPTPTSTTPPSVPSTTTTTPPAPQAVAGTETFTFSSGHTIGMSYYSGWSEYSKGPPAVFTNGGSGALSVQMVNTNSSVTLNSLVQNYLSSLQITFTSQQSGTGSLNWQTFTQDYIEDFSGTVTTQQGTSQMYGQIIVFFNPTLDIGAEFLAFADNSSDYASIQPTILNMLKSTSNFAS